MGKWCDSEYHRLFLVLNCRGTGLPTTSMMSFTSKSKTSCMSRTSTPLHWTLSLIHDPRSGAIKRSALEKTEPTINYESFVNELDTGDSFTTSIIDILVKVCSLTWSSCCALNSFDIRSWLNDGPGLVSATEGSLLTAQQKACDC